MRDPSPATAGPSTAPRGSRAFPWGWVAGIAAAVALPVVVRTPFFVHVLAMICLYGLLALAWNLLGGYAGQVSLGHAVYFGLGAYTTAQAAAVAGIAPWPAMALGMLVAAAVALAVGYPTFRLRGHYFAIATIALGQIVFTLFTNWEWAGGAIGIFVPIRPDGLWNLQWRSRVPYYYVILTMLVAAALLTRYIERHRMGFYLKAIKDDQDAARSAGVPVLRYKLYAAALSAALTAAGGAFYVQYSLYIDPTSAFSLDLSIEICLIAILGGVGTVWGPLIGAAILIPLSEATRGFLGGRGSALDLLVYGALIMIIAAVQPGGIMAWVRHRRAGVPAPVHEGGKEAPARVGSPS